MMAVLPVKCCIPLVVHLRGRAVLPLFSWGRRCSSSAPGCSSDQPSGSAVGGLEVFAQDLHARGLLAHTMPDLPRSSGFHALSPLSPVLYAGFDPTADSLHVGNLLVLCSLLRARTAKCRPIALVGGATACVGDPSGHRADRVVLDRATIARNSAAITTQLREMDANLAQLPEFAACEEENALRVVNNMDWYDQMSAIDFLRMAQRFRVGEMLRLGPIKTRVADRDGISYTEFSYQILQAYDWLQLLQRYSCSVQIGGSDQLGHFDAGYHYIQKLSPSHPVYGLCLPLVVDDSGNKLGKSSTDASAAVWLSAERTSPYAFYQFWRQMPDKCVERLLPYFSLRAMTEIASILLEHRARLGEWLAQRVLADEMTLLVHGSEGLHLAQRCSKALFEGTVEAFAGLGQSTIEQLIGEAAIVDLTWNSISTMRDLALHTRSDRLNDATIAKLFGERAMRVNGQRMSDANARLPTKMEEFCLPGTRLTLISWGKRKYSAVRWR